MYWWKTGKLAEDIKNGRFSQKTRKNYYLAVTISIMLFTYLAFLSPPNNLYAMAIETILIIVITIIGINVTFKSNGGNEGLDYVSRMTALSFPLMMKIFVLSFVFGLSSAIYIDVSGNVEAEEWSSAIFVVFIQVLFFTWINKYIKYINTSTDP